MKSFIYLFIFTLVLPAYIEANSDRSIVMTTLEIWDMANNSKDDETLSTLYDTTINYYGREMNKKESLRDKRRLFKKYPYFLQEISNIEISEVSTHIYKISFSKNVTTNSKQKAKSYPSYLLVDAAKNKIISESDLITDKNKLRKEKEKKQAQEAKQEKQAQEVKQTQEEKQEKQVQEVENQKETPIKLVKEMEETEENHQPIKKEVSIQTENNITKKTQEKPSSRLYSYDKTYTITGKIQLEHAGEKDEVSTYVLKLNRLIRVVSHDLTSKTTVTNEIQLASLEKLKVLDQAYKEGKNIKISGKLYAGFSRYHIRDVILDVITAEITK